MQMSCCTQPRSRGEKWSAPALLQLLPLLVYLPLEGGEAGTKPMSPAYLMTAVQLQAPIHRWGRKWDLSAFVGQFRTATIPFETSCLYALYAASTTKTVEMYCIASTKLGIEARHTCSKDAKGFSIGTVAPLPGCLVPSTTFAPSSAIETTTRSRAPS